MRSELGSKDHELERVQNEKIVAQTAEFAALGFLLPVVFLDALGSVPDPGGREWRLFMMGAALPIATFIFGLVLSHITTLSKWKFALFSTFGGGNRGTLLLLALIPLLHLDQKVAVASFLLVDLGNFVSLMLVMPWLFALFLREKDQEAISVPASYAGIVKPSLPLGIPAFLVIGGYWLLVSAFSGHKELVFAIADAVGPSAKHALAFTLFLAIFLRARPSVSALGTTISAMGPAAVSRFVAAFSIASIAVIDSQSEATFFPSLFEYLPSYGGIALFVLIFSPPSSIVPKMLSNVVPAAEGEAYTMQSILMVFFLILLILVLGLGFLQPESVRAA